MMYVFITSMFLCHFNKLPVISVALLLNVTASASEEAEAHPVLLTSCASVF